MAKTEIRAAASTSGTIQSTKEKIAEGKVKARITAVWFLGSAIILSLLGGFIYSIMHPDKMEQLWFVCVPLITVFVSGISFLAVGQRQQE